MAKVSADERLESLTALRKLLKPGATVHCVLRHVSASGMSRRIDFYTIESDEMVYLSGYISKLLGLPRHRSKQGLTVEGCGMDMGFSVVYELGQALFPKGFIPAKAKRHGRNGTPATERDSDGGYALKHSWL